MKQFIPLLIALLFLGILVGANIYLTKRFVWYYGIDNKRPSYILFASSTLFMIAGVIAFSNSTGVMGHLLYGAAAIIMGFLLYLLISVILVDIISFIIKLHPKWYGFAALILAATVSAYAIWNSYKIRTAEIEVGIKGLNQEVKAMHLTDIHLGHFRGEGFLQRIVELTKEQQVDMVLITGDLFDGKIRLYDESLEPLKRLNIPVYFVAGNHDRYSGVDQVKNKLQATGVKVLENEVVSLAEFQIIGLAHMLADTVTYDMHTSDEYATIKSVLAGLQTEADKPTILLHHSPDGIQYANEKGVDLYLAGHTHGGQLFPINYLGELLYTYNKGLFNYKGTKIYVSQGAGTFGPPMRFGTNSEITLVRFIPEIQ